MKQQLWNKAFDAMVERYGSPAPVEIANRLLTEQAELQSTDMLVYFDLLSILAKEAKKQGETIRVKGRTGASFTAYLLGATEINPLKPHYLCPKCHASIFDTTAADGWDLPKRACSCGREMCADGHNIPIEAYRHVVHRNTGVDLSVSPEYFLSAKTTVMNYFKDCKITSTEREQKVITFRVVSEKSERFISLWADEEFTRYKALQSATGTCFERVPFASAELLKEFQSYNTEGITNFKTGFMKNMLHSIAPRSFRELIQITGLLHGTGVWLDNGSLLVENGHSAANVIAYGDDVFNYIREKLLDKGISDTGFAYKVMEDTRRGVYVKNGVPDDVKHCLNAIGMEDWFIESIGKISYLFPKAHGVTYVKTAATLMWYKLHYPKEFKEIML